ncbi:hypothetical protein Spb1_32960 [Planctopirus ephydatiae]|uniref:Uncharacterized protein n=1 Tax=Planctopirus ephydatiae TaxID=2528019 RepID=A0A518GRY5_9PLAN|nr:hypothetical protein Spb1_32960 [Planctopirus ephydatiae]
MFSMVSDVLFKLLEDDGKLPCELLFAGKSVTCCRESYLRVCELLVSTCLSD